VALALINILLLLLGTVMEGLSLMVILAPLFLQVMQRFGIDPIHFGVVLIVNLTIGSVSPPIGSVLFTVCSITKCSIEEFTRESIPLLIALIVVLFLITFLPDTVLLLPRMLF
jgi:TRAP-type C4-dicarboxylate transport system permease large subunit